MYFYGSRAWRDAWARDFSTFFFSTIKFVLCFRTAYSGLRLLGLVSVHWFGLGNSTRETCARQTFREIESETAGKWLRRMGALYQ